MSEEKQKRYELEINGEIFQLQEEIFNLLLNISHERDYGLNLVNNIIEAKQKFGNDSDLGRFVRSLLNDMGNLNNQKPKTLA
jgi:methyl coenzyme M reductase subunit D